MKIKFILALLLFTCVSVSAQTNWLWARKGTCATNGTNGCSSVTSDTMGNAFITGWFNCSSITFGTTTLTNANNIGSFADLYIAKYDPNGNFLWAKSVGGMGDEYCNSIKADDSGNVYVAGYFGSPSITFGSFTLINTGTHHNIFIAKYDPNGNVLWARSAGGIGVDEAHSVWPDHSGNVFLTGGFTSSSITFGSTVLNNSSYHSHIFLTKYDNNGNVLWAKTAGVNATNGDFSYSVTADQNGNPFICGYFSGATITLGSITLTNALGYNWDLFLAKYDANGNALWAKRAGDMGNENGFSVCADNLGNVYMTGEFGGDSIQFGSTTLYNVNGTNVFLAKYDGNGNVLWAKGAGGTNVDQGFSVSVDDAKNVFISGEFYIDTIHFDSFTLIQPPGNNYNFFLVKLTETGTVICASSLGSGYNGNGGHNYVSVDYHGNAYFGGEFMANPFVIGADTLIPTGEDIFLAKYRSDCFPEEVGINEISNENSFNIFPNPSDGTFSVQIKNPNGKISVCNVLGEIIFQSEIHGSTSTLDLSNQPDGLYIVNVSDGKEFYSQKILIQK